MIDSRLTNQVAGIAKQRGAALQVLFNIIILLSVAFVSIKLFNLYWDDWKIKKLFVNLATELPAKPHTEKDVEMRIKRQFEVVDYISGIKVEDSLVLKKNKGTTLVDFTYERRIPFVANLDLIGQFSHKLEYPTPGRK